MTETLDKLHGGGNQIAANPLPSSNIKKSGFPERSSSWLSLLTVNMLMVALGMGISHYISPVGRHAGPHNLPVTEPSGGGGSNEELLGSHGALLYRSLDTNKDGTIDSQEFGPIVEKLTGDVCLYLYSFCC